MTEEEARELMARSARNRAERGKPIYPKNGAAPTCCQPARPSGVSIKDMAAAEISGIISAMERKNDPGYQAEIERRYAEVEQRGEVMVLDIPAEPKRRNKYGNRRTEVFGIPFDSKHEAEVYRQLMAKVKAGELKCVWRQVKFDLGGGQNASRDSRYAYYADFVTVDNENRVEVLDAKSEATRKNRTYINKKKQVIAEWGLEIKEV